MIYHPLMNLATIKTSTGETINFSKNKCSELETIDPIFNDLVKSYPNFRHWLKTTCYDRDCICAFNSHNEIVGLLIYSFKDKCKHIGPNKPAWKISTLDIDIGYKKENIGTTLYNLFIKLKTTDDPVYLTCYADAAVDKFMKSLGLEAQSYKKTTGELVYMKDFSPKMA